MLWVIKVESYKDGTMNFCEMLWVNLELLQLLKILMTALLNKVLYSTLSLFTQVSAEVYKSIPSTYCWG